MSVSLSRHTEDGATRLFEHRHEQPNPSPRKRPCGLTGNTRYIGVRFVREEKEGKNEID